MSTKKEQQISELIQVFSHMRRSGHRAITQLKDVYIEEPIVQQFDTSISNLLSLTGNGKREPQYSGDIVDMSRKGLMEQTAALRAETFNIERLRNLANKEIADQQYRDQLQAELDASRKKVKNEDIKE